MSDSTMAQDMDSPGTSSIIQDGSTQRDVLQQIIAEGLNFSPDASDSDLKRNIRLLQVLFETCVLTPSRSSPSPSTSEQIDLTMAVIIRQCDSHPSLLQQQTTFVEGSSSLFKWILPRIIHAASRFIEYEEGKEIYGSIVQGAVDLIRLLKKDDISPLNQLKVSVMIRDLINFCESECILPDVSLTVEGADETRLLDYQLTASPAVFCTTIDIVLHLQSPFVDQITSTVCRLLSDKAKVMLHCPSIRGQYIALVTRVMCGEFHIPTLYPACIAIVSTIEAQLEHFLSAIPADHIALRYECWHALWKKADELSAARDTHKVVYILTAISDVLSSKQIRLSLSTQILDRWTKEIVEVPGEAASRLQALLVANLRSTSVATKKRKRSPEVHARDLFQEVFPSQTLSEDAFLLDATRAMPT